MLAEWRCQIQAPPCRGDLTALSGSGPAGVEATLHGIHRATMHALRAGENVPRLDTAMRMAADLGVAVEVLWERVAA